MQLPIELDNALSFTHGFLKALEIVANRKVGISVGIYKRNGTLEADLALHLKKCKIQYSTIKTSLSNRDEFIKKSWSPLDISLSHLSPTVREDLKWQFEECVGLLSTAIDERGPFNPLFSAPIHEVKFKSDNKGSLHTLEIGDWTLVFFGEHSA
ncbi:hypothetical protein ACI2KX_16700 [Ectopseudomonas khazarica]|uniref:hypothetical protein n=1 Tax=Ectopseudomonas khazarica TaxID=2502979 RepID=UPI00384AA864